MLAVPIDAARPDAISVPRKHEFQIWEPCLKVTFEALDNTARPWQEAAHHAPMVPGAGVVVRRSGTAPSCARSSALLIFAFHAENPVLKVGKADVITTRFST